MNKALNKNNWQTKKLGEVLEYEQPSLYIVSSKNYKDDYETPVLTAGKSFILGKTKEKNGIFPKDKLPVIIFDDFTTATKFVDFPFKVKSSAMKILHSVKNISDAKFLFHLMQNISFDHTGIHKRYWISEYSKIEILLPPLPEQHRIVKILDDVFEKMAKAKENAKKNLQNAKELFESYLQNIFANPGKDWEEETLNNICIVERGSSPRPIKKFITNNSDGVNWIKIGDTKNIDRYLYTTRQKITKEGAEKSRYVKEGDLIISNSMSFGRPYIMKTSGYIHDGWFVLRPNANIHPEFFYDLLSSPQIQKQITILASGAVVKNISGDLIKKVILPIPTITEQKSIVAKLSNFSAETKKLEAIYKQKLADLEELKKSVLKKAFNGKL